MKSEKCNRKTRGENKGTAFSVDTFLLWYIGKNAMDIKSIEEGLMLCDVILSEYQQRNLICLSAEPKS